MTTMTMTRTPPAPTRLLETATLLVLLVVVTSPAHAAVSPATLRLATPGLADAEVSVVSPATLRLATPGLADAAPQVSAFSTTNSTNPDDSASSSGVSLTTILIICAAMGGAIMIGCVCYLIKYNREAKEEIERKRVQQMETAKHVLEAHGHMIDDSMFDPKTGRRTRAASVSMSPTASFKKKIAAMTVDPNGNPVGAAGAQGSPNHRKRQIKILTPRDSAGKPKRKMSVSPRGSITGVVPSGAGGPVMSNPNARRGSHFHVQPILSPHALNPEQQRRGSRSHSVSSAAGSGAGSPKHHHKHHLATHASSEAHGHHKHHHHHHHHRRGSKTPSAAGSEDAGSRRGSHAGSHHGSHHGSHQHRGSHKHRGSHIVVLPGAMDTEEQVSPRRGSHHGSPRSPRHHRDGSDGGKHKLHHHHSHHKHHHRRHSSRANNGAAVASEEQ
eukprot:TRINITY_DN66967_c11_g1_i2.p1 TRINITY_DN66967_c11_g1~~TRINITY_DN66967_c11_g1_i2.p1  ORF type:complete len:442 (-),score=201.81 TRINITY_DN66967_c11_g1_i2:873-2198(-)